MNNTILILNTGGTFNKIYNPIKGELEILSNNNLLNKIIENSFKNNLDIKVEGIIYKDSLDIIIEDRFLILDKIKDYNNILIVHGTDTMNKTARFLYDHLKYNKKVVLTGSMNPFIVDSIEASSNLAIAIFFLLNFNKNGIFICMHGLVADHKKMIKKYKKLLTIDTKKCKVALMKVIQ